MRKCVSKSVSKCVYVCVYVWRAVAAQTEARHTVYKRKCVYVYVCVFVQDTHCVCVFVKTDAAA